MNEPPKRRRYQFRLRTLLIVVTLVAVPCAYVGWQAKVVRERRALLDSLKAAGGGAIPVFHYEYIPPPPPWIRRVFGDETVEELLVPPKTDEETMARIRHLFPGAHILVGTRD